LKKLLDFEDPHVSPKSRSFFKISSMERSLTKASILMRLLPMVLLSKLLFFMVTNLKRYKTFFCWM